MKLVARMTTFQLPSPIRAYILDRSNSHITAVNKSEILSDAVDLSVLK